MCDHGRGLGGRTVAAAGTRQAQAASGELRAGIDGSGGGGGVAYEARGYKQGWADERAERRASRRPKSRRTILARYVYSCNGKRMWLVILISSSTLTSSRSQ